MSVVRVEAEGSLDSKICLVGEAPGVQEVVTGRPFVGPAGNELMKILHMVGIARSDCYITNVVKEHPPKDDFTVFLRFTSRGDPIETPAYQRYVEELKEELSRCKANVIVPLGNNTLWALCGRTGITKWRGSILESTLLPGRKCIPTIHPSAALRQYIYTHFIRMDLHKVLQQSNEPDIKLPERSLIINPSYDSILEYLDRVSRSQVVAFDIEVVNEEISCISFALSPTNAISIPFVSGGSETMSPDKELEVWLRIASILENPDIVKIGQNLAFDVTFLYRKFGIKTRRIEDTMVGMAIAFPDFPKGLDFITSVFTNEPYYKEDGKKWFKLMANEYSFWVYNAKDSAVCIEAYPEILNRLRMQNNIRTYERQRSLIEPLVYMQERGLRIDVEGLKKASMEAEEQIMEKMEELTKVAGFELNPNSPKQLASYFYVTKRLQPYYKDGKITTDDDAMRRLARKGIQEAILIRDIRKLRKLKGTYYDINLSKDGRLRSAMNPVGTKTGRLSSSEDIFGEGGNIQNLPDQMKAFIIPDDGMVLYNVDLSQAENRIVAYIAPEPIMKEAFESGIDVHARTASLIFGIPIEQVSDEPGSCQLGTGEHSQRFWGKKTNHSLNYDLGYKSFALKFDMQEREAFTIVERYHQVYPGVRQYHAWVRSKLQKDRTLTNLMGRSRVFLGRWGDELFKEAYAFIPQSTVADVINERGIIRIYYGSDMKAVDLLNQVHDSLVFQIPESVGWEEHARILLAIKSSLEIPLEWHGEQFVIPCDIRMCNNLTKKGSMEVKVDGKGIERLATDLHGIYRQLRASSSI